LNNKIIEWGSIKALQMWADLRPEAMKSMTSGQAAQARNVAERLHVPQGRITTSPSRPAAASTILLKSVIPPSSGMPMSTAPSAFWSPVQSPANPWGSSSPTTGLLAFGRPTSAPNGNGSKPSADVSIPQTISKVPPDKPDAFASHERITDTDRDI